MLLDGVGIEDIFEAVSTPGLGSKVAEESFELYDKGLALSQAYNARGSLPQSLFQFIDFLAEKVSHKELYLVIVEKLAWVEQLGPGDEEIREGGLVYLLYSFQLCYKGRERWGAKERFRGNSIVEGLGMVLSSIASILSRQRARDNGLRPSFDILDVTLKFCRGLAMQSGEWSPQTSTSNASRWKEDEALSICAFVLNIVAHFVVVIKSEELRAKYMVVVLDIIGVLHVDISRIVEQLRRARAFLFESKRCEALGFETMNALEDSGQFLDNYDTLADEDSKDDVNELVKQMPLGLFGSGLNDGSPMEHLCGLERVILTNHSDEQRQVLLDYALACFETGVDSKGANMGSVELVPWKAVSDETVRAALRRLQQYWEKRDGKSCPIDSRLRRLLGQARSQRLPGASETEATCWPVLGCAMVGCYWLRKSLLAGGMYAPDYLYASFEPLLYPLLRHPHIAVCEALKLSVSLGQLLPCHGEGEGTAARYLMGYTYACSSALVDTNGYKQTEAEQRVHGVRSMGRKREFGVNAVVSHLAACQKGPGEYAREIYCLGRLGAMSTDSFFVVQSLVTSIVQSPEEMRTQEAFAALQKRLLLFEDKGLYLLLRQLVQECPYPNVSGLLIDLIKSCSQATSRCVMWQTPTLLGRAVSSGSWARNGVPRESVLRKKAIQVSKSMSPVFFTQSCRNEVDSKVQEKVKETRLDVIAEEILVLAWQAASPFWSPLGILTYSRAGLQAIVELSSTQLEHDIDAIAAAVLLFLHCKQRLRAEAHADTPCLRAFLDPYALSAVKEGSEASLKCALDEVFVPLNALARDALTTISGMVVRRDKAGEAGPHTLRLQVLQMNLEAILDLE